MRRWFVSSGISGINFLLFLFLLSLLVTLYCQFFWVWRNYQGRSLFKKDIFFAQDFFVSDRAKNINDQYTKQSAYLIMQRYIRNGGNIYELYNYVNSHPELVFLREAEDIYPEAFRMIQGKRRPSYYTDEGMYVYLAYSEVLDRYGYANDSLLSAMSYRYAQMAYYEKIIAEDKAQGRSLNYPDYPDDERRMNLEKAIFFAQKIEPDVLKMVRGEADIATEPSSDIVGSTVQYAFALRYLESLGVHSFPPEMSSEVFGFALEYSRKFVPSLYFDTVLSNAVTLLLASPKDSGEIRNAIFPFLGFRVANDNPNVVIGRILRSRVEVPHARYGDLSIYSRQNIISLAEKVPEFKSWLISNGWSDADFQ